VKNYLKQNLYFSKGKFSSSTSQKTCYEYEGKV